MKEKVCISYLNSSGEFIPLTTLGEKMEGLYGQLMTEAGSIECSLKREERFVLSDLAAAKLNSAMEVIDSAATFMDDYAPAAGMTYSEIEIENDPGPNLIEDRLKITDAKEWLLGAHKTLYAMDLFCNEDIFKMAADAPGQLADISGLLKAMEQELTIIMSRMDMISKGRITMAGEQERTFAANKGDRGITMKTEKESPAPGII